MAGSAWSFHPLKADTAWHATSVADGSVRAAKIQDELDLAFNTINSSVWINDPDTMIDIITVTIDVPTIGHVHLTGLATILQNTTDVATVQIDDEAGGTAEYPYASQLIGHGPVFVQRVYQVSAGSHTFRIEGLPQTKAQTTTVAPSSLTTVFYPTTYGTVVTK